MTKFNELPADERRWLARLGGYAANEKYGSAQTAAARATFRARLIARYIPDAASLDSGTIERRYKQVLGIHMRRVRRARTEKAAARRRAAQEALQAPTTAAEPTPTNA